MRPHQAIHAVNVEELKDQLLGQVAMLAGTGLPADKVFLVAIKRMSGLDTLSR
jgi:hypothetical protein